ncbi:ferrochelatase [Oecophyllibacter saccharovorans]|uniref:Ferrochelatase n=1 Tax=Oecophyllibacter saccharovorans TaxID=2558360 RepID=A0A506URU4_9PROT|nr:ferrochelatase [Oecophyllibacter saccharovorans]TPW36076.1 ferrochelatase [Oecophyllibacter saccharovorans]
MSGGLSPFIHHPPHEPVPPNGRIGVLLINLGTPSGTDYFSVRRYLGEFLSDRRVIEMTPWLWKPILHGMVLATRPFRSGANYARIWDRTHNASPLTVITRAQAEGLAKELGPQTPVSWGMRYGTPSISQGLDSLLAQGCDRIVCLPMYPQYSATTTATANDQVFRHLMRLRCQPAIVTVLPFADDPAYIGALAQSVRACWSRLSFTPQRLVVSFHGLPKSYVTAGDPYPRECALTVKALSAVLDMPPQQVLLTYQSRFGPAEWLQPYTLPTVTALAQQGIKDIAVIAPGFMTDCIETLDELDHELREAFLQAGGKNFAYVPCLNATPQAIGLLAGLSRQAMRGLERP